MTDDAWPLGTSFYDADTNEPMHGMEWAVPLNIGDGLIWHEGGQRFRVVDRWVSFDHHGQLDIGIHIWLKDVTNSDDDRPKATRPYYYSSAADDDEIPDARGGDASWK